MAICVGYFEPASAAAARTFTVSGLVSSKARWRQFEPLWTRALRHESLASFNAQDFSGHTGEFLTGWIDPARQRRLLDALTQIVEQHVFAAFSCSVMLDDFERVSAEYGPDSVASPYSICAGVLMTDVRRWMAHRRPEDLTLCVFEDGELDHRALTRIARAESTDVGEPPQMWPREWIDEHGRRRHLRPLEACGLFEVSGALAHRLADRSRYHGHAIAPSDLARLCKALDAARRNVGAASGAQWRETAAACRV